MMFDSGFRPTTGPFDPAFNPEFKGDPPAAAPATLDTEYVGTGGHVVSGVKWPFSFARGRVALSHDDRHIIQNVQQILATAKGEYLMLPEFGSSLHRRVFDPVNLVPLLTSDIAESIERWEPRCSFVRVDASFADAALGVITLNVDIAIQGEPVTVNLDVRR